MVLIQFKLGEDVPALDADRLRTGVNKALVQSQSTLRMESGDFAYGGYGLHMNGVASQQELSVLRGAIIAICVEAGYKGEPWVGLPQSTSYLKIRNAPYFRDGDLSVRTTPADIINAFRASPLSDWFKPAAPARIDPSSASPALSARQLLTPESHFARIAGGGAIPRLLAEVRAHARRAADLIENASTVNAAAYARGMRRLPLRSPPPPQETPAPIPSDALPVDETTALSDPESATSGSIASIVNGSKQNTPKYVPFSSMGDAATLT
ncbi:hypothetical protein MD484_g8228, partial [Candolleomyces efflorescens]